MDIIYTHTHLHVAPVVYIDIIYLTSTTSIDDKNIIFIYKSLSGNVPYICGALQHVDIYHLLDVCFFLLFVCYLFVL